MREVHHKTQLCVVGGGLAGMSAAIAAARRGTKVVLMQDRPVFGGNASSEVRMWVCGAHGDNNRETGLIEEFALENLYRNPTSNYSIWDSVLYEKVKFEDNITVLLNCTCTELDMDGDRIRQIKGWQMTAETWHTVEADLFADCSGDSILAPLSGAEFRVGREACSEYDESIEPEKADSQTMGLSLLIQARETDGLQTFIPPTWAYVYESDADLPHRGHDLLRTNFWWIELGGDRDSIHDTEEIRDELLKVAFGVWDHMKNRGDHGADNWTLEWMGFLPGKRESRRYVGDYVLNQNDVRAEGRFDDIAAYGGWTMDDHHPAGINYPGEPTIFHPAPSPFGIPYRSMYSRNIANLFCAGRNISTSHAALSATRVMATCATVGQAVGTAAAVAARDGLTPRGVYEQGVHELQQMLMEDDCYLPFTRRTVPKLTAEAKITAEIGNPENLRSGYDRPIGRSLNAWEAPVGTPVTYSFGSLQHVKGIRLVLDSHLNRPDHNMPCNYPRNRPPASVPKTMIKSFIVEIQDEHDRWHTVLREENNYQRLVRHSLGVRGKAIRLIPRSTWGQDTARVFAWDVY